MGPVGDFLEDPSPFSKSEIFGPVLQVGPRRSRFFFDWGKGVIIYGTAKGFWVKNAYVLGRKTWISTS